MKLKMMETYTIYDYTHNKVHEVHEAHGTQYSWIEEWTHRFGSNMIAKRKPKAKSQE